MVGERCLHLQWRPGACQPASRSHTIESCQQKSGETGRAASAGPPPPHRGLNIKPAITFLWNNIFAKLLWCEFLPVFCANYICWWSHGSIKVYWPATAATLRACSVRQQGLFYSHFPKKIGWPARTGLNRCGVAACTSLLLPPWPMVAPALPAQQLDHPVLRYEFHSSCIMQLRN